MQNLQKGAKFHITIHVEVFAGSAYLWLFCAAFAVRGRIRAILRLDVKHLVTGALGCSAVLPSPKRPRRYKFYSQSPSRPQVPRAPFHPTTHRAPRPPPRPFPLPRRGGRPGPRRGRVSSVTNCSLAFPPALASSSSSRLARFPNRKQVTGRDVLVREIF